MQTKGISLNGILKSLEALYGAETYRETVAALGGELGERVRMGALLSGGWYPLAWYRELHATAQMVTGRRADLARELSRAATLADFRGVYRLLTFVLSPRAILRKAPSVWNRYYDRGKVEIGEAGDTFTVVRVSDCEGFDLSLWEDVTGGCLGVTEACGGKDVRATLLGGGRDGDPGMQVELRWKP
jgi:hypothetical protein